MRGPSLRWGLLVALATVVFLAIGVGVASLVSLRSIAREQAQVLEEEAAERAAVHQLLTLSERRARHVRTWLLTRTPRAWAQVVETRRQWESRWDALEEILTTEEEKALLGHIRERQLAVQEARERLIARVEQGASTQEVAEYLETELSQLRARLDEALAALAAHEEEELQSIIDRQERTRLRAVSQLGLAMLGAVLVSALLGTWLVRSLRQLEAGRQRLTDSLAVQDALYESAPVGLGLFDEGLRCLRLNSAFSALGEYPEAQCQGRPAGELLPRLATPVTEELRRVLDTGGSRKNVALCAELPSSPGLVRHWLCDFYPVRTEGRLLGVGAIFSEVTARRRAEEAVRQSEARFRTIFNQAAVGLAQVGLDGCWQLLNERYCDILGYGPEELLGRPFADITHREDVEVDVGNIGRLRDGEFSSFVREKRYVRKDGAVVWVTLSVSLVRNDAGESQYFLAVAEDITRRKALEEERTLLLAETREALRLREEFLSVASHEMRTPLTPLSLRLQVLLREAQAHGELPFAHRVEEQVRQAKRQVERMTRLIDELLDVSHMGAGLLGLFLEDVDLTALAREVARRFEPVAMHSGSSLEVDARAPVVGRWDRRRLEQVVSSLLSNALKFGAGRPVRLCVEQEGRVVRLTVRDEGIGIAPEELPRIFGRFSRGVSDRHYGGLGLGLFLTRYVVESLGGEVRAESTPGKGSTFVVQLPLVAGEGGGESLARTQG